MFSPEIVGELFDAEGSLVLDNYTRRELLRCGPLTLATLWPILPLIAQGFGTKPEHKREVSTLPHLQDGKEFELSIRQLLAYGRKLFEARFTSQEGAGGP